MNRLLLLLRAALAVGLSSSVPGRASAEPDRAAAYTPSPEKLASRAWFEGARFGVFLRWGRYSQPVVALALDGRRGHRPRPH